MAPRELPVGGASRCAAGAETRDGPAGGASRCAAGAAAGDGASAPCDWSSLKLAPRRRQKCPAARGLFAW
jgi:hypothetical protein